MFDYLFLEAAQKDYESSVVWYSDRSLMSANRFVSSLDSTLIQICEDPFRWRNEHKNFYEVGLRKFPFSIVYKINEAENLIIVVSIFHHKRNPGKKYRR